ncbi:MAG: hypothetical protein DYG89_07150 [Caldilinea sp. CFX5]|nr:hypothetical protein [Caldilinea sp. CFX5]
MIAVSCFITVALLTAPLAAHGGGVPRLTDEVVGPYRVFAWTQPDPLRVGDIHLSIGVVAAAKNAGGLDEAVTDATVTVYLAPTTGEMAPIQVAALLQEQLGSYYYEADATLPTTGEWRFTIEVSGTAGNGSVAFVSEVLAARQINWYLIVAAGLLLIALLGLIGLWNRMQANPQQRM